MEKFSKWLLEKKIITKVNIDDAEAVPANDETEIDAGATQPAVNPRAAKPKAKLAPAAPTKAISTMETLEKYPAVMDEIAEIFGTAFISDAEMDDESFGGLFFKTALNRSTDKISRSLNVAVNSAALNIIENKLKGKYSPSGSNWEFTLPSGAMIKVHQSSKTKGYKYITNGTAFQEATYALLMQYSIEDKEIPRSANKEYAKDPVLGWMMESDITTKSGFWHYFNYEVPANDTETFYDEVKRFVTSGTPSWSKSFTAVSKINWRDKINNLYKETETTPPDWKKPLFIHDNLKLKAGETLKRKVAEFLRGNRCGIPKDEVDKTDVLLIFNTDTINPILDKIASFTKESQIEEHNKYINDLINGGILLGISLKKTGSSVNVAAVNFNISTTAVGDNIKDDSKVLVKFDPKNPNNSTLNNAKTYKPPFKSDVVTYKLLIPFNEGHAKDMHAEGEDGVGVAVRVSGGAVQVNFGVGTRVFLGKGNDALKGSEKLLKELNYSGVDATQIYKKALGDNTDKESSAKAIYTVVESVYKAIVSNPAAFAKIFTKAIGYPLAIQRGKKTDYEIVSTPYVKIY